VVQDFFHPQYGVWFARQKKVQLLLSQGQHSISTAILEQSISHLSFKSLAAWWLLGVIPPNTLGSITIQRRNQVEQPVYKDDRRFWTLIIWFCCSSILIRANLDIPLEASDEPVMFFL
jgi:hypothetical protein